MAVIKKESHQTWIGTAAEMALFTSMLAGDKFITTDTKLEYEYTGAAWIIKSTGVQLSGSNVEIGGVSFAVSGGDTIRNTAANKPDAAAAHAVIPFCYYFSVDTSIVEVTNGTSWVVI